MQVPQLRLKIVPPEKLCSSPPKLERREAPPPAAEFTQRFAYAEALTHLKHTVEAIHDNEQLGKLALVLSDLR